MQLQVMREVQQPDGDVRKLLDVVQSDMLRNLANMTNPCASLAVLMHVPRHT